MRWSSSGSSTHSYSRSGKHHLHLHLSLNLEGRWGTTDDFTTSFFHLFLLLFCTALWDLVNSRPVHSLVMSSHLFFCRPQATSQPIPSIFSSSSVLHCPLRLGELQASAFPDVVLPPLLLSALSSSPFQGRMKRLFSSSFGSVLSDCCGLPKHNNAKIVAHSKDPMFTFQQRRTNGRWCGNTNILHNSNRTLKNDGCDCFRLEEKK